jgi:hypothetical protein
MGERDQPRRGSVERTSVNASPSTEPRPLRISRLEWGVAAVTAMVGIALVVAEPAILEAPVENTRTITFTLGGTVAAAVALVVMLRLRVPSPLRVVVLGVPFVAVSWWLVAPFFIDDVVHDEFGTSIAAASERSGPPQPAGESPATGGPPDAESPVTVGDSDAEPPPTGGGSASTTATSAEGTGSSTESAPPSVPESSTPAEPVGPVLLGAGQIAGLAGHEGTGDAGVFRLDDGSHVLRLEHLDIQNGPDLHLYVVPGADQTSPGEGSLYLGALRGNVGDLTYELPTNFIPTPGSWTVLVWCEAFDVEFVAATVLVA